MLKLMYKRWWKVIGALLIIYTIIAGIGIPVGPGMRSLTPSAAVEGAQTQFHITGYNTHFEDASATLQPLIRINKEYYCADTFSIINNDDLTATFTIPADVEARYLRLIINNDKDGTFAWKDSIRILPSDGTTGIGASNPCVPEVTSNDPAYLSFPYRVILYETIRNLYFHVPMWFTMTFLLLLSFISSIAYLRGFRYKWDIVAAQTANVAVIFGILGFATGAWWGNFTWGQLDKWLIQDAKVLGAMIGILMYLAYFILRGSMEDEEKRARIGAVYNIFAFAMFIVFIYIMPRMTATLHPGSGGNPAFNIYDVDGTMRWVFYPAAIGWILIGMWISSIKIRMKILQYKMLNITI